MNLSKVLLPTKVKKYFNKTNEQIDCNGQFEMNIQTQNTANVSEPSTSSLADHPQNDFQCVKNVMEYFRTIKLVTFRDVMLIKLKVSENFDGFEAKESQKLIEKFKDSNVVIFIAVEESDKFFLSWKSEKIEYFLIFKIYEHLTFMHDWKFFNFIAEFLVKSLKSGHLGIHSHAQIQPDSNTIQLHLLADHRHYHLLLLAAESGDIYIVNFLLPSGIGTEYSGTSAQDLAWNNGHYEVVSLLIRNNSTYPKKINISKCPDDIKKFQRVCQDLRSAMLTRNTDKIDKILSKNQDIQYFYDFNNESVLAFSLKHKLFDVYAHLLANSLSFGPHEDFNKIKAQMTEKELEKLREVQYNDTRFQPGNHMYILLSNSRLGQDKSNPKEKFEMIKDAFAILNENPFLQIILMIVAASRRFRIVFDFRYDSVEFIDPTATSYMRGVFYSTGRIYIGAKNLSDSVKKFETLGTLIHEMCHHAMNVVYKNFAKPYWFGDNKASNEFEEISKFCRKNSEKEVIIYLVYSNYSSSESHAELIVRVPQLIAQYLNDQEKLQDIRQNYGKLFDVYENRVMSEMKNALPSIESDAENEVERNEELARKLLLIAISVGFVAIFGIISGILVTKFVVSKPVYSFTSLSSDENFRVKNAEVIYKDMRVKLIDILSEDSGGYERLTSEHISEILDGKNLNFNDLHLQYLDGLINHDWRNMTNILKTKFLNSNVYFQGALISFSNLYNLTASAFDYLTSKQILEVLNNKSLNISKIPEIEVDFYIDRKFRDENIEEIYINFMRYINGNKKAYECYFENHTESAMTFKNYYKNFTSWKFNEQMDIISEIKSDDALKKCTIDDLAVFDPNDINSVTDSLQIQSLYEQEFGEIFEEVTDKRVFILSAEAGAGKTVTFEYLALRLKRMLPAKWVSYIDLKEFKHFYNSSGYVDDVKQLLNKILGLNLENQFELNIFEGLYENGNVILLWNGVDEISPNYKEFILNVLSFIKHNSSNIQFVCTRPLYSNEIKLKLQSKAFTLVPLDVVKQHEFLTKFFYSQEIETEKIQNYSQKVMKIVNYTQSNGDFNTPLLLGMIAELIAKDMDIFDSENLYDIYHKFVENKIRIWREKSEFGRKFLENLAYKNSGFNIKKLYQNHALKIKLAPLSNKMVYLNSLKLKIMRQKIPKELTGDEISRMGILYINGHDFRFAHRTFAEFFVAQYIIDNIYNAEDVDSELEAKLRLKVFKSIFVSYGSSNLMITKFMESYLDTKAAWEIKDFSEKFIKNFKDEYRRIFFDMLKFNYLGSNLFATLVKFFQRNRKLLIELLHVYENETFYTATYNWAYFDYETAEIEQNSIKKLISGYLNQTEYEKFINGRNQKGIIEFSMFCFYKHRRRTIVHEEYILAKDLLSNKNDFHVFDSIVNNLTKPELVELLMSNSSPILHWQVQLYAKRELWARVEKFLTKNEQKQMVKAISNEYTLYYDCKRGQKMLLGKVAEFLTDSEIFKHFRRKNILHYLASFGYNPFHVIWNFFVNHTTKEQQKIILTKDFEMDCNLRVILFIDGCYTPISFNMLHLSSFTYAIDGLEFEYVRRIYENYFTKAEILDFVVSSSDFLPYIILLHSSRWNVVNEYLLKDLKEIFEGHEKSLREFILRKIYLTNLNVFELLADYEGAEKYLKMLNELILEMK